ncbi:hypothetical protein HY745_02310 [Candidatus Desantisbacteria bacterium]|nr:hypothetical protein [Candidatus Desantisbacteria bacterium]
MKYIEKIKKKSLEFLVFICAIFFYLGLWKFTYILHEKTGTSTVWDLFIKDPSFFSFNKLPGKIQEIKKEKKWKKTEQIIHPGEKIKPEHVEIIIKKNDTLNNIIGTHYGKYNDEILKIVKDANPEFNLLNLTVGQKITDLNVFYNKKWISIKGELYNEKWEDVSFLKVNFAFFDKWDKIVSSNFTYISGNHPLKTGEKKKFEFMTEYLSAITRYEIWLEY